jgi:penicillin amidase
MTNDNPPRGPGELTASDSEHVGRYDLALRRVEPPHSAWRVTRGVAVALLLATFVALLWMAWRLWWPLPRVSGHVRVPGPSAAIEILRDEDGVPHIRAGSEVDALFGLGYVHAQDRLWQMEFQRRLGHGRLAEFLGPAALPSDRLFRTVGLTRHARAVLAGASPATRAHVDAYVRGINAFLAGRGRSGLPFEFGLLGVTPEPWQPEDVIVWAKVLSWELSFNWRDELLRTRIIARAGVDAAATLMPPATSASPVILPEAAPLEAPHAHASHANGGNVDLQLVARLARTAEAMREFAAVAPATPASNNWVVSGARTDTGRPLLANDPHLSAQMPALWYLAHLQGGGLDVIGATLPGAPGVIVGHNRRIAWGVTAVMTDNQDLFVERINARNEALYRGQWEPMTIRSEVIRVKGTADEVMAVRATRHGPLVSDVVPEAREALALSWSALVVPDRSFDAFLGIDVAGSWTEFEAALEGYRAPMQNFVFADVEGNIGYYAPGAIPRRRVGDGTVPVPGWTGDYDWDGEVPARSWPRILNPTRGFVVSANNPVFPPDAFPDVISTNWEPGYRAARITEMLEAAPRVSVDVMARMQADVRSAQARTLLPWLRRARPSDEPSRRAFEQLLAWDGELGATSSRAAIFEAWTSRVAARLFADDLGEALWREYSRWPFWAAKALDHVVAHPGDHWCDDVRTPDRETCEDVLGEALRDAVKDLSARQGTADVEGWQWGRDNQVVFPHLPLHLVSWLRPFVSRTVTAGGDTFTVNPVMHVSDRTIISSYRQVIDLSNLDASRFVTTTGQSGQRASAHYDDLLPRWNRGEYVPMRFTREAVDAAVKSRLVLEPNKEHRTAETGWGGF